MTDRATPPSSAFVAAVAMSLYRYNVAPAHRAERLYMTFRERGLPCGEPWDFLEWVDDPQWATFMPLPTALLYQRHAIEEYGAEALERVTTEMRLTDKELLL